MSLKQKTIKGVKWTSFSSIYLSLVQILQIIILTKFLKPEEFGLMAIILFIVNFSQNFIDFGVSNAIIHKQNISQNALNSLYILSLGIGLLIFLIIFFSAELISNYYDNVRLIYPLKIIAIMFVIIPIGQQFQVLLRKKLDFKSIAQRDIASRTFGFILTIILAYKGFGINSIVYGNLLYCVVSTILLVIMGVKIYKPKIYFNYHDIKPMLSFGLFQMGEKIVNYLNKEIDVLIIGKFLGMEALGVYNIAKEFISKPYQIINPIITKVTFPVMATIQDDTYRVKKIYLQTLKYLSIVNSLIFLFCFYFSDEIVQVFFGTEWLKSSIILKILSIYMLIRSISNPVGSLQLAMGRADLGFYWNLVLLLLVPISIYLGKDFGIIGVSISLLICQVILYYPSWKYMVNKLSPITFAEYNLVQYKFWILASITGLMAFVIIGFLSNFYLKFIVGGILAVVFYCFGLYFINNEFKDLIQKNILRVKSTFNK